MEENEDGCEGMQKPIPVHDVPKYVPIFEFLKAVNE